MRTILTILIVLLLVAAAFLAFFIVTFDADSYLPLVTSKLESAFGKPVDLQGISLTWDDGIALKLTGLAVYPGKTKTGDPVVRFDEASTLVRFFPLLQKDVQISALKLIRPSLHLLRTRQGEVILYETQVLEKPDPTESAPQAVKAGSPVSEPPKVSGMPPVPLVPIFIDSVEIEDGSLRITDKTGELAEDIYVNQVDVTLQNVSYARNIPFQVDVAIFSREQNIHIKGQFRVDMKQQAGTIEKLSAETNLDLLDWGKLQAAFPAIRAAGLRDKPKGHARLEIDSLQLNLQGMADIRGNLIFRDGKLNLEQIESPLENIQLQTLIEKERIQVKSLSLEMAGGTVIGLGAVEHLTRTPQIAFEVKAEHLNLDALLPKSNSEEPSLSGQFTGSFQGTSVGIDWPRISQTLSGQGRVTLVNGVLHNLNILQEVFRNLSVIPGLVDKLRSRLPESYEEKLSAKDTVLKPIEFPILMQRGVASVRDLQVSTDTFDIRGTGQFGLNGSVEMQTFISIEPDLSKAFIRSVNELQYLTNPEGQLQIPIQVTGVAPDIRVMPDVPYVASKLAVSKTQEVIGKILEKKIKKDEKAVPQEGTSEGAPEETKKPDLWGQLLETALEGVGPRSGKQPAGQS